MPALPPLGLLVAFLAPGAPPLADAEARLYRVWDPATLAPLVLAAVRVESRRLTLDAKAPGRSRPVEFRLRLWTNRTALLLDTTESFPLTVGPRWSDTVRVLPGSEGITGWTLLARHRSRGLLPSRVHDTPPLRGTTPMLSDIVISQGTTGTGWSTADGPVEASPHADFTRDRLLETFVQIRSRFALPGLQVRMTATRLRGGRPEPRQWLSLTTALSLQSGLTEQRRALDLREFPAGDWRISVELLTPAGREITAEWTDFRLR
ncbi:MAG: hypothetical protein AB7N73_11885 [Gemmatimonadales bacterium]|nr:hypothetical protein [Gemmatimonadales bacterium]